MRTRSFYSGKNWTSCIFAKLPPGLPQMTEWNTNTCLDVDMTWLPLWPLPPVLRPGLAYWTVWKGDRGGAS